MQNCWLQAACEFSFDVEIPTPMVFMLRARSDRFQWIASENYEVAPSTVVSEYTDQFGNLCQRLTAPVGEFSVKTSVRALLHSPAVRDESAPFVEVSQLPDGVLAYLLPSRYCESDRFSNMAAEIAGSLPPGYPQVAAICDWVQANIDNVPLSSTYPVSATEVNQKGEGVCRDLAHVTIALCRALCLPARLAVGYLHELEPMDAHAWVEVFLGGHWYGFDPTQPGWSARRITVARGRDAADVALYNQYGPLLLPTDMKVHVEIVDSDTAAGGEVP